MPTPEERRFSAERNALTTVLTSLLTLVDNLVDKYLELISKLRKTDDEIEEDEERKD